MLIKMNKITLAHQVSEEMSQRKLTLIDEVENVIFSEGSDKLLKSRVFHFTWTPLDIEETIRKC